MTLAAKELPTSVKRLSGRRIAAMTFCVGFQCRDGLVLAADRQMSMGHTYQDCKLHGLNWKNGRGMWGFAADNIATAGDFWENLEKVFTPSAEINRNDIKDRIKGVLADTLNSKPNDEAFQVLFGAWTEGEQMVLFRTFGKDVSYGERCEVIGSGDSSLSRFLRGLFLKNDPIDRWQGIFAAAYFLKQEKLYDGQYVGGDTDIYFLTSPTSLLQILMGPMVTQFESKMNSIEVLIASLVSAATDRTADQQMVEEREETLRRLLEELKQMIPKI
jgi:hypothetical protein